jgi:hypothetical protein
VPFRCFGAVHEAEYNPERQEDKQRHWEREGHPRAEGDGLLLREVGRPHPDEDDVHAGARQRGHPADRRCVHHAEYHRPGELPHLAAAGVVTLRELLQDPRRHRHHHDRARRVVDPRAEEHGRAGDAQQQELRPHRVTAEQRRDLRTQKPNILFSKRPVGDEYHGSCWQL